MGVVLPNTVRRRDPLRRFLSVSPQSVLAHNGNDSSPPGLLAECTVDCGGRGEVDGLIQLDFSTPTAVRRSVRLWSGSYRTCLEATSK